MIPPTVNASARAPARWSRLAGQLGTPVDGQATITLVSSSRPTALGPAPAVAFDWLMAALGLVLVYGVYLGAWADSHGEFQGNLVSTWYLPAFLGYFGRSSRCSRSAASTPCHAARGDGRATSRRPATRPRFSAPS